MRRLVPAAFSAVLMAGCATGPAPDTAAVVRTRAPVNYENTVASYFDLMVPNAPANRKLVFGTPETSPCVMFGRHLGWVVPVVFDVQSTTSGASPPKPAGPTAGKTGVAAKPPANATSTSGTGPISLNEVSITGSRYFFWFNNDTLGAVTRRADLCP